MSLQPSQVNNSAIRHALLAQDLLDDKGLWAPTCLELLGRLVDDYRRNVAGTTGEATARTQAAEWEARRQRRIDATVRAAVAARGE
jgi:hypothetical protein